MKNDNSNFKVEFKKRLYKFVLNLIKFLDKLPKDGVTKVIGGQLLRSGTSIIGNYVEATASSSRKDFTNFFNHSLKSANESKLWLCLLKDTGRADPQQVEDFLNELEEISKIFGSSILKLRGKK